MQESLLASKMWKTKGRPRSTKGRRDNKLFIPFEISIQWPEVRVEFKVE